MTLMEIQLREERDLDLEVVKYILTSVRYEGVPQAIRFIESKDPATGKYIHTFQPLAQLGICKICYLEEQMHYVPKAAYRPRSFPALVGDIECPICYETVSQDQCFTLSCRHSFCKTCLTDSLSFSLNRGEMDKLICAECHA